MLYEIWLKSDDAYCGGQFQFEASKVELVEPVGEVQIGSDKGVVTYAAMLIDGKRFEWSEGINQRDVKVRGKK